MELTLKQEKYIKILEKTFCIKDAHGHIFPYRPTSFQIEFHAASMLCNDSFKHRIWSKSRGVGATTCTMLDMLMLAHTRDNVRIPVSSKTGEMAGNPIAVACWLADNTQIQNFFQRDKSVQSVCRLDNGSEIFSVPGGSPDVIRGVRAIAICHDEFAFNDHANSIYIAGEGCLSEGGQTTIASTWNGSSNEYARIWNNAENLGFQKFEACAILGDFDVSQTIQEQIQSKKCYLAVPWLDLTRMEALRRYDSIAFMQEYQCQPNDADVAFLDWKLITEHCRVGLDQDRRISVNPYFVGIDFATESDYSSFAVFELTQEFGAVMRHLKAFRKMDTVAQNEHLELMDRDFGFTKIIIDETGPGKGFFDHARAKFGSKCIGVNFAQKVRPIGPTGEKVDAMQRRQLQWKLATVPIKRAMANALRNALIDDRCWIINDLEIKRDLNSVPYDSLDAPKNKLGHGDRFWSCAMALYAMQMPTSLDPVYVTDLSGKDEIKEQSCSQDENLLPMEIIEARRMQEEMEDKK